MKSATRILLLSSAALIGLACGSSDSEAMSAGELALQNAGSDLDGSGPCATIAQINSACPPDLAWDNHGQYVSCVARYLSARVEAGDIDEDDKGALVSEAARSSIGKKKAGDQHWPDFGDCDTIDDGSGGAGFGGHGHDDDDDDDDGDDDGGADGDDDSGAGVGGRDDGGGGQGGFDGDDDGGGQGGSAGDGQNDAGADSSWGGHP